MSYTPRLQEKYKNEIVQVLKEKFNYKSKTKVKLTNYTKMKN